MTVNVLTVNRIPVTETMKTHPLATRSGIAMLSHLIEADQVWSSCTKPQRSLLAELCPPAVAVLLEQGALKLADMPVLPDRVMAATRAAMRRRGLINDDGRLTGCAVHAWFYAGRLKEVSAADAVGIDEETTQERTQDAVSRYQDTEVDA